MLGNEGFLRDQGILSLESVQQFYTAIEQEPERARVRVSNLLDFCPRTGYHKLDYQPVIALTMKSSQTGEAKDHAVVLHSYYRGENYLVLLTIDSASECGYTYVYCSVVYQNGRKKLMIGQFQDQLCLGSEKCNVVYFN